MSSLDSILQQKQEILHNLKENLTKTRQRMENQANKHRMDVTFQTGYMVLLRLQPYQQQTVAKRTSQKLTKRYFGLFTGSKRSPMSWICRLLPEFIPWCMSLNFGNISDLTLPHTSNLFLSSLMTLHHQINHLPSFKNLPLHKTRSTPHKPRLAEGKTITTKTARFSSSKMNKDLSCLKKRVIPKKRKIRLWRHQRKRKNMRRVLSGEMKELRLFTHPKLIQFLSLPPT